MTAQDPEPLHPQNDSDELTGLAGRIQLAAAEDDTNPGSEHDAAIVEAFIETLARIAHSVASRKPDQGDQEE